MHSEVFGKLNTATTPYEPCSLLEIDGHIIPIKTIKPVLPKSTNIRLNNIERKGNIITAIADLWGKTCEVILETQGNCANGAF